VLQLEFSDTEKRVEQSSVIILSSVTYHWSLVYRRCERSKHSNKIKHQSPDDAYNSNLTWTTSTAAVLNMKSTLTSHHSHFLEMT